MLSAGGWRTVVRIVLAAFALGVPLFGAPAAQALRYASPTGKSTDNCQTPATACDLLTAVHGKTGDEPNKGEEVIVEPGSYSVSHELEPGAGEMDVHGVAGKSRPIITGLNTSVFRTNNLTLGYLEIEEQGNPEALSLSGGVIERVLLRGTPGGDVLCQCYGGTLRNSVIVALPGSTAGAVGLHSNGGTSNEVLRNDTIYSESAQAPAIELEQQDIHGPELILNAYNTIAVNSAGGHDISSTKFSTIVMTHSDYSSTTGAGTVTDGGGQVTAPPLFANAAAGDFQELAGSPTIDAGLTEGANGTLDFEGIPRELDGATDIGAYEHIPPPSCTPITAATAFGQPLALQLQCADALGAPLTYALTAAPQHGALTLSAATGRALYTPAAGYSGADLFSYDATSSHGTAASVSAQLTVGAEPVLLPTLASPGVSVPDSPGASVPALTLGGLAETARVWREGRALAHITAVHTKHKLPLGTTFSFTLNRPASVTFTFITRATGRKLPSRCVAQSKSDRTDPRCTRTVTAGTIAFAAHAGLNSVRFQGLISKREHLRPGNYTLLLSALAPGGNPANGTLRFTITDGK
jgi:hypothetical protein